MMLTTIRGTSKYLSFRKLNKTMAHDVTETPTNLRTLLILEVLGKSDRPMTATEINAELGLPKQTVHRLCVTLEEHGFITRPDNSRKYQVGRRLREKRTAEQLTLKQIANRTGLSVSLISQIELGKSAASMSTLHKLATALQVRMTYFFETI